MTITWEIGATIAAIVSLGSAVINIFITLNQSKKMRTAEIITGNRVEWMQKLKDYISTYIGKVEYYYDKKIPDDIDNYLNDLYHMTSRINLHLNFNGTYDKEILQYIESLNKSFENFLQLSKYKNVFSKDQDKKGEAVSEVVDFYLYNYPEKIGKYVGKNILIKDKVNLNNKEECKEYYLNLINNKDDYYKKMYNEIMEYIDIDLKKSAESIKYVPKLIMLLTQIYLKTEWERVKYEAQNGTAKGFNYDDKYKTYREIMNKEISELEDKIHHL